MADLAAAGRCRALAEQRLQQGRFAGAVSPDQGHPLAALDVEGDVRHQGAPGHSDVQPFGLEHHPAAALGRREVEVQSPLVGRPVDPLDARHRLQLALRLTRFGAVAKPVDEPLQMRQLLLLALVLVGLGAIRSARSLRQCE